MLPMGHNARVIFLERVYMQLVDIIGVKKRKREYVR